MRARLALVFVVPFGLLALWAVSPSSSPSLNDPAVQQALGQIRPEAIEAHIRFLADDLLEGRGTGTRGHELAARYLAAQFEALGLEPAGADGTYFQPVPLRKTELVEEQASLTLVRGGQELKLAYGEHYVMRGDPLRLESSVAAPVVFVDFGVTAPELGYDDYAGVDVRRRIVALVSGAPASFPHDQRAYYSSGTVKVKNAVAHGARGLLILRTPKQEKQFSWAHVRRHLKAGAMRWLDEAGRPNDVFPEMQVAALLSQTGAEALFAGAPTSLEEIFATARESKPQAFELPVQARLRRVSRHTPLESPNVAAVLRGSDPKLRDQYVVYTAHVDHMGIGEPVNGDAIYNGALDNASGTAVLLEVARAFAELPQPPRRSVLFLGVTAEEMGLLGSDYFVHHSTVPRESLVANVNLDGALMLHPLRDVIAFGAEHSNLAEAVEQAADRLGLKLSPDPMPDEVLFVRSDQYSFVRKGVPGVFMVEGWNTGDPETDGGALLRQWIQTRYHTPQDDFSQGMDFGAGAKFARVNFLIGYLVANQDSPPAWNPGDFFGEKFAPQAPASR